MTARSAASSEAWPSLPLEAWSETCATLHMWTQIVGKVRLVQSPRVNHSWHATLYVTARGLSTSPIPYGTRLFQIDFDFVSHQLTLQSTDGGAGGFALEPQSVAVFYARLMEEMSKLHLLCQQILAGPRSGRPNLQGVSREVHRQVQSGAFLLGRPGSGRHSVFGPAGS